MKTLVESILSKNVKVRTGQINWPDWIDKGVLDYFSFSVTWCAGLLKHGNDWNYNLDLMEDDFEWLMEWLNRMKETELGKVLQGKRSVTYIRCYYNHQDPGPKNVFQIDLAYGSHKRVATTEESIKRTMKSGKGPDRYKVRTRIVKNGTKLQIDIVE